LSIFARLGAALPPLDPFARVTDTARLKALDELLGERAGEVAECQALSAEPTASIDRIDAIARATLGALRSRGPFETLDTWVRTDAAEILDAPDIDPEVRAEALRRLEALNEESGAHALFAGALEAALDDRPAPHVYEVAAGTGGFARRAGPGLRDARPELRWTVSDLDAGGLETGAEDPSWLRKEARDAVALGDISGVDLFLCVQAAHHLSPGMVVRFLARASRAPLGALILDVHRGGVVAGVAGVVGAALGQNRIVALDGMRSARRAYTPAELALLARLAGARVVRAGPLGPAYAVLHAVRP